MISTKVYLVLLISTVESVIYQAKFEVSEIGFTFSPYDSNDLLNVQNNIFSITHCVKQCLTDIRCRTINFNTSAGTCFLYTAWIFQGVFSLSATSKNSYIDQQPNLYSSYFQPCVPDFNSINRYLQCVNSLWICPDSYFFNGYVCEYWRSFGSPCQTDQWCDSSRYLVCPLLMGQCICNYSMEWTGSICTSACPSGQIGITFDDVPALTAVPVGYAGFQWFNVEILNGTLYNNNGYYLALNGMSQVAFNPNANTMNISRINGTFTLNSLIIPFIWMSNLNVTITGFYMGSSLYSALFFLNTTYIWIVTLNWTNIDSFIIESSPHTNASQVSINDICITL